MQNGNLKQLSTVTKVNDEVLEELCSGGYELLEQWL